MQARKLATPGACRQRVRGIPGDEIPRGVAEELRQWCQCSAREERLQRGELGLDFRSQCVFQRGSQRGRVRRHEAGQPLLTPAEQACNQRDDPIRVVVQALEQPPPHGVVSGRGVELGPGSFDIHRLGALNQARQCAQLHRQRRLPHQRHAQRVDRMHLQARRMRKQIPAERRVTFQRRRRETPGQSAMRFGR